MLCVEFLGLCNENNINGLIEYFTHNTCPSLLWYVHLYLRTEAFYLLTNS